LLLPLKVTTGSSSKGAEVDMEDLCTTCEQVPQEEKAKGVCTYPMKAAKKRPREEDTQVTVLEWRAKGEEDEEGLFLVVKRPEKGTIFRSSCRALGYR
jgi:A/G-specific adenine glycosylase